MVNISAIQQYKKSSEYGGWSTVTFTEPFGRAEHFPLLLRNLLAELFIIFIFCLSGLFLKNVTNRTLRIAKTSLFCHICHDIFFVNGCFVHFDMHSMLNFALFEP
jgi:hypothetical protein